ncbi:flagellin [Pontibacterium granulatum]|uniref:flagellin N-terminal helical domain-containing protein n=1 Tax=Pontibacterium granulatum TaxID=2036029 RepID=UPI00249B84B0|nr:flagellin [Pontibacterium granulatum]MDI3322909.1 flagellin [Pontibacterium granulatum]
MAMVINSNIMSLNAQRNLESAQNQQNQAMERLTSGKRINSAADDAAGLGIASRMTSQINGLNQAVRNANDGISMIQTAEGALDESTNILQRMRELSVQSANGTYTEGNRSTLNAEVQQLVAELDRIAETTSFNGQNILDGSSGKTSLQVGSESNQTISFEIEAMDAKTLGLGSTSSDVLGAEMAATVAGTAASYTLSDGDIQINGQNIGEFDGSTDDLEDLVDSINTNVNGVTAGTYIEAGATDVGDGILEGTESMTISYDRTDGTTASIEVSDTQNLDELVDKINEQGRGEIAASLDDDGQLVISSNVAQEIRVTDAAGAGGAGLNGSTTYAQLTLSSDNGDPIEITRGTTGTLADLNALGFRESNEQGEIEGAQIESAAAATAWGVGDVTINGVQIDETDTDSLTGKIDAINASSDETGVVANAFATATLELGDVNITSAFAAAGSDFEINGVTVEVSGATDVESLATAINAQQSKTGVVATANGNTIILESDQGAIDFEIATASAVTGLEDANLVEFNADGTTDTTALGSAGTATDLTVDAGIKLTSTNGNPISVELGDNATAAEIGLLESNTTSAGRFGQAVNSIDISTANGAQKAIDIIDNALEQVNDTRSELGAVNNRLDFTINNLSNVAENASAARSRIEDADFAAESANLSRAQVLQQAGTAMLAQANAAPQQVLSLLQ